MSDKAVREWRDYWNGVIREARRKKKELGLCNVVMCLKPVKDGSIYCEYHWLKHAVSRDRRKK